MSSKTDGILLIPGPGGWEIWQGNRERGFRRSLENGAMQASGIGKIPPGRLLMGFPVREALAVPFKVQTDDEAMFDDLVSMHLEKSGIRPEEDAGRLTDVFPAGREDGQTTLLSVVLSAPAEGTMPQRAPVGFDISARLFPMAGNAVTLWQELGRWVFAVTSGGHLAYFQSLSGSGLGADAVRDIRLALTQLSLQGVSLDVDKAVIWTTGHHSDPTDDAIHEFGRELGSEVSAEPKPRPVLPAPMSRLVPADVRAQHRARAERRKRVVIIAAVLLAYLGLAGFLAYDYFRLDGDLKKQRAELEQTRLRHSGIGLFKDDWKQLAPVVDSQHWPLHLLERSFRAIPPGPRQNMRFTEFEATRTGITIKGEAANEKLASTFGGQLKRAFRDYGWKLPQARENKKKRWEFTYTADLKGEGEEQ